jgi:ElaB/YqjD/DUF883 family membrane-anchored ribosome-binding protein
MTSNTTTLREAVSDSASRVADIGSQGLEQSKEIAASLSEQLRRIREYVADLRQELTRSAGDAARATDEYVHENPRKWAGTLAALAAVAVAAFMLMANRE